MAAYYREVYRLEDKFDGLKLNHIPRSLNEAADTVVKAASSREPMPTGVFANDQHKPATRSQNRVVMVCPILIRGMNNHRLHLALKSWSSKKIQRQSLALWSTREHSTSTTSSMTHY